MPGQLSLLHSTWTAGVRGGVHTLTTAASPGPLHGPVENRNTSTDVKCTVNEREHRTNKVRQSAHQAGKEQPSAPSWVDCGGAACPRVGRAERPRALASGVP